MVFSSVTFLFFFLPIFLACYFAVPGIPGKNFVLLIFSLVFYGWGEPTFLPLLVASILFNTFAALRIDRHEGRARLAATTVAVVVNLALLAAFKYGAFIAANLDWTLGAFGVRVPVPNLPLPLGISFFTFHCLSYVIDVYRRRFPANRRPLEVALYITMFPQLVAGPVVRYRTVSGQLRARRHRWWRAAIGARIFLAGLAQKVLVADQVAPFVEAAFDRTPLPTLLEAWAGLLAYTIQIYFDFAGYSNMAVGLGLILGFAMPRNFRLPYTARSVTDFWRRWHMSLSQWLRDYLYIPLGGSRGGPVRTYRNLALVFLLCGLWHGASWNFVLWGAWHGGFLALERFGLGRLLARAPSPLGWGYTMLAVMGGWVLFRAQDLTAAGHMYAGLAGRHGIADLGLDTHAALHPLMVLALAAGCALAIAPRRPRHPGARPPRRIAIEAATLGLLILSMLGVAAGTYSPFLYFRF